MTIAPADRRVLTRRKRDVGWLGIIGDLRTALEKTPVAETVLRELLTANVATPVVAR